MKLQKRQNNLGSFSRQTIQHLSNPNLCPSHWYWQSWSWPVLSSKSRDTWNIRQVWLWSTKWSRQKANRVLSREHAGHCKHSFPTTQETTLHMDITRWSTWQSDWLCSLQSLIYLNNVINSFWKLWKAKFRSQKGHERHFSKNTKCGETTQENNERRWLSLMPLYFIFFQF